MSDDEDWVHPSRRGKVEVDDVPGLRFADIDAIRSWAVKLTFIKDGSPKVGSGFFVNIPDTPFHIIFTAAHNLSTIGGTLTTKLTVLYTDPDVKSYVVRDPQDPDSDPILDPDRGVYVCNGYKNTGKPEADYGFIRIPNDTNQPRRGFGFSIKLAYEDYFKGNMYVTGFQDKTKEGYPFMSSGPCVECYPKRVEYGITTQAGISGSAVWIEYRGSPVVVAVHNNGPERVGGGSRGARLTPELFRNLFSWLSPAVIQTDVQLRAQDPRRQPTIHPRGFFLSFEGRMGFARVRLGSGTKFDVMPAQVTPGSDLYALAVAGEWVQFNPLDIWNAVVTTKKLEDRCLFRKEFGNQKVRKWLKIVVTNGKSDYQLRLDGQRIKDYDKDDEDSDVSLARYPQDDKELFNKFWFE